MKKIIRRIRRLIGHDFSTKYGWSYNPDKQASQNGEDGIIEEICHRLDVEDGWFVEFGAWDGILYSNTYALLQNGWHGVYIEGDQERADELAQNMRAYPRIISLCRFISAEGENRLDAILAGTPIPREFDLLSIDVDGNDYWLWKSLTDYRPKIVVIEYNANFRPDESKTIPYDAGHNWDETMFYGASAAALNKLGGDKDYMLVAYTRKLNLFFVRRDLATDRFEPLGVENVPTGKVHVQRRREEFIEV